MRKEKTMHKFHQEFVSLVKKCYEDKKFDIHYVYEIYLNPMQFSEAYLTAEDFEEVTGIPVEDYDPKGPDYPEPKR